MRQAAILLGLVAGGCACVFALNPSLDISQYAHTAWTVRDGFSLGNIYAIAQTPDGYLWLGSEFGLYRFDGVRIVAWEPPAGQQLPDRNINSLLVTRDGTLWIGTFAGLVTWSGGKLARRALPGSQFVASLFEDSEGTVWCGTLGTPRGLLCSMRGGNGSTHCYGEDGAFGRAVWALYEDNSGTLWAGAQSGLWRMKPSPLRRYATAAELIGMNRADDGRLLVAMHGAGLLQLRGDKLELFPIRGAINPHRPLPGSDVNSNRLIRDRDGGLWVGAVDRGLIHLHQGRTDLFKRADGLSGDVILSMFEDREGNVWVSTTGGLDRFRELPVATISVKQGLSSDASQAVLAAKDGSIWIGAHAGLNRWSNGQITIFDKASGLPDDGPQSLFQDHRGRIWVSTRKGLAYFQDGRFVAATAATVGIVHFMAGDNAGNLWLSEHQNLLHLFEGRLIDKRPWSELGRPQSAEVLLSGPEEGGVWLGFWLEGGVLYFKDGRLRSSYTAADGLGRGYVTDLQFDHAGALWAATQSGASRIKAGRIATLTTNNGLPCDTIHWTIEDDDRSFWLYSACGLVRIRQSELEAWIADPKRRIEISVWDGAGGVRLRSTAASEYGPRVTKSSDGKIWYVTGEGIQVIDPRHIPINTVPPPVHIEQVKANGKPQQRGRPVRLGANIRDLSIEYTALSLTAPEKVRFKYMLEGQDAGWHEVVNDRRAQYSNLPPRDYRFRVIACNNSGVWNETGDTLEFSIDPRFYQTAWFGAACVAGFLTLLWGAYRFRVRQLQHEFNLRLEGRVEERTRIARELHDTLLQSFQGLMFSFQAVRNMLPGRTEEAVHSLDEAIREGDEAIAEGRDAILGLRANPAVESNLEHLLTAAGKELTRSYTGEGRAPEFRVTTEGARQPLSPLLQDEVYRIAREVLGNAFHHARASRIEGELAYNSQFFVLRIRDNGKGIDPTVLERGAQHRHFGLQGVRERAKRIGAQFKLWSEPGAGTEAELKVPARLAYRLEQRRNGLRLFRKSKVETCPPDKNLFRSLR